MGRKCVGFGAKKLVTGDSGMENGNGCESEAEVWGLGVSSLVSESERWGSLDLGDCTVVLHDHAEVGKERYLVHIHAGLARELQRHLDVRVVAWPSMERNNLFLRCLIEVQEGLVALRESLDEIRVGVGEVIDLGTNDEQRKRKRKRKMMRERNREAERERGREGERERERERERGQEDIEREKGVREGGRRRAEHVTAASCRDSLSRCCSPP